MAERKTPFAPLSTEELRLCARKGAVAHLEELASKVRAAFPELHVAVMITDARFAPPSKIVRGPRGGGGRRVAAPDAPAKGKHRRPRSAAFRKKMARAMRKRWKAAKRNGQSTLSASKAAE